MRLDPRAFAYASAAVWGSGVLIVASANLSHPGYGQAFLACLQSLCPGYAAARTWESVLTAAGYAIAYGGILGWVLACLYNRLVK